HEHGADVVDGQRGLDPVVGVGGPQRHPVAGLDPLGGEGPGYQAHALEQRGVGDAVVAVGHRERVPELLRGPGQGRRCGPGLRDGAGALRGDAQGASSVRFARRARLHGYTSKCLVGYRIGSGESQWTIRAGGTVMTDTTVPTAQAAGVAQTDEDAAFAAEVREWLADNLTGGFAELKGLG